MSMQFRISGSHALLVALALGTAGSSWGAIAACATTAPGGSLASFGTVNTPTNGCRQDDLSYGALNLTGGTSAGGGTTPTTANIDIFSTGTAASANTVGPVNLFVDGFASIGGGGTSSESGTVAALVTANTGAGVGGGAAYTAPTNASLHWAFLGLQLNPTAAEVDTGDTITITENFCLNATQATVGGNCTTADHGILSATFTGSTTPVFTCAFGTAGVCATAASSLANFAGLTSLNITTIDLTEAVSITRAATTTVTLTNIEDIFTEQAVPEPGTFGLIGVAFAGLGVMTFRRRKQ